MPTVMLMDRALIAVDGEDAEHFLQNLITTDLDALAEGESLPGALLTPQGKILFDFLISREGSGFILECRKDIAADFIKRLMIYRLRAKVGISESDQAVVSVSWGDDSGTSSGIRDKRFFDETVLRHYGSETSGSADAEDYHSFRIASGVGESGDDFELGDAFPHDVLFDQNSGVSFKKGCFVGQEVVSRMQHRGTARKRLLLVRGKQNLPAPGSEITAGERAIGTLGSVAASEGLALVRIDRAAKAMSEGIPVLAGDAVIELAIPTWAGFSFPDAAAEADQT
ncbi:MAG: folate-binding protein YgfZ [Rhizobiaceae bacterium]